MIALTVAEAADIVGGTLTDITPADAARTVITGTVEFDSRAIGSGSLFLALPGARSDGHDHAAAAVAAGAVAVLAARPVGVPAIVVQPRAGDVSASVPRARPRRFGCGGAGGAGQTGRGRRRTPGRRRIDDHRRHRFLRQDVHQGPAGRGFSHRWAR